MQRRGAPIRCAIRYSPVAMIRGIFTSQSCALRLAISDWIPAAARAFGGLDEDHAVQLAKMPEAGMGGQYCHESNRVGARFGSGAVFVVAVFAVIRECSLIG
jgi:hypothetical protein